MSEEDLAEHFRREAKKFTTEQLDEMIRELEEALGLQPGECSEVSKGI